jgi:RecB family endonuclease NucS
MNTIENHRINIIRLERLKQHNNWLDCYTGMLRLLPSMQTVNPSVIGVLVIVNLRFLQIKRRKNTFLYVTSVTIGHVSF